MSFRIEHITHRAHTHRAMTTFARTKSDFAFLNLSQTIIDVELFISVK